MKEVFVYEELKQVTERTKDLKPEEKTLVYLEGYTDYSSNAAGSGGAEMIDLAGGINIAATEAVPYPKVSPEWVVSKWLYPQLFADLNPEAMHKEFLSRFHGLEAKGAWVYPGEH